MWRGAFLGHDERQQKDLADLPIWGEGDNPDLDITIRAIVLGIS